ncbi:hypothetical protein [Paenibacillus amylolyticus]|uniref:hypothetical protein n=1 Tax=Paenibacillus amylolyticus TaxID=1451 RepID=UPI00339AC093
MRNGFLLVYFILIFALLQELKYLNLMGWIIVILLSIIGIFLQKPFESLGRGFEKLSTTLKIVLGLENFLIMYLAYAYGNNLIIATLGFLAIALTIMVGSISFRDKRTNQKFLRGD